MAKTYVIGDIHGGLRALKQLLELTPFTSEDLLVFVGDYVDGWSESAETISYLLDFSETYNCKFLRGNHEELLYNFLKNGVANPTWLASGGRSSLDSYAKLSEVEKRKHITFLEALENFYIDTDNRLYVHAGFTNIHGPQHEFYPRMVYWDRTLWETACSVNPELNEDHLLYPKRLALFKEIFIGHTPVTRIGNSQPTNFANVWNVDTGAAFKGALSIMEVKSKQIWQSDPVWKLYPEENGRN